jgi:hypothetical protein
VALPRWKRSWLAVPAREKVSYAIVLRSRAAVTAMGSNPEFAYVLWKTKGKRELRG